MRLEKEKGGSGRARTVGLRLSLNRSPVRPGPGHAGSPTASPAGFVCVSQQTDLPTNRVRQPRGAPGSTLNARLQGFPTEVGHQLPRVSREWEWFPGLYVLVGAGALMMAMGFFGCCGAMRESQCVLGSFFTCLLVIFAAEVTTGVFAFIGKGVAIRHVQTMYEEAYNDYLKDKGKGNGTLITFHSTFQCCGKESSEQVQPTCPKELLKHKNCIDEIETVISVKLQLVGIVGIGIAGLTIFGMIFSMVLCCAIRNSQDVI
ncbi:tetraspanin-2 isoform X1 [Loxodonta africana]|uniref:tetraspanin-2 isoform X1 n=1 Tax=Loxodonta africana TaxID=9785 RepID=UPI000C810D2A|nr:tetraspanin-2 isoform X2 [Loxodonta africana]